MDFRNLFQKQNFQPLKLIQGQPNPKVIQTKKKATQLKPPPTQPMPVFYPPFFNGKFLIPLRPVAHFLTWRNGERIGPLFTALVSGEDVSGYVSRVCWGRGWIFKGETTNNTRLYIYNYIHI